MFIVLEGTDSSGKQTQTELLYEYMKQKGKNVRKIAFPDYDSASSALVKMYLSGEFGKSADSVSPYAASSFYAVDRYASYKRDWGEFLKNGGTVIADRYTTSNMIHQCAKLKTEAEKEAFLDWVSDFEYVKLGLPKPDKVIFLNMPPDAARRLMSGRANKITGKEALDIHEADPEYMKRSYQNAVYVAKKRGWSEIMCAEGGTIRSIEEIHKEITGII
ncbi:MAG: thymidylate kinase [Clostridia bacterium]|nr:thymidylate kinase [Clostridia bacterium]